MIGGSVDPEHAERPIYQEQPHLTIIDVIREANNEHEIYFLLTAYVEAVRYGDKFNTLPAQMRDLPLADMANVKERVDKIKAGLDRTNFLDRPIIKEAMDIFIVALDRLGSLKGGTLHRMPVAA